MVSCNWSVPFGGGGQDGWEAGGDVWLLCGGQLVEDEEVERVMVLLGEACIHRIDLTFQRSGFACCLMSS